MARGLYRYLLEPMPCSREEILDFLRRTRAEARMAEAITKWLTVGLVATAWIVFGWLARYMFSIGYLVAGLASLVAFSFGYWGYRNYHEFYMFVDKLYTMVDRGEVSPRLLCNQQLGFMSSSDLDELARISRLAPRD